MGRPGGQLIYAKPHQRWLALVCASEAVFGWWLYRITLDLEEKTEEDLQLHPSRLPKSGRFTKVFTKFQALKLKYVPASGYLDILAPLDGPKLFDLFLP